MDKLHSSDTGAVGDPLSDSDETPSLHHKRRLSSSSAASAQDPGLNGSKRLRTSATGPSDTADSRFLLVHIVLCKAKHDGHRLHKRLHIYLDHPRLYSGDSGASRLRGKDPISSIAQYVEDLQTRKLVIIRDYQCEDYHELLRDNFTAVELQTPNAKVPLSLLPHLQVLVEDGIPAQPFSERFFPDISLSKAMRTLADKIPDILPDWKQALVPPYLQVYHARESIRSLANEILAGEALESALLVLDYVELHFEEDYRDAEDLFSRGLVSVDQLSKLFRHNDLLVRFEENEHVCYIVNSGPSKPTTSFDLDCCTWSFNGSFRREKTSINISWPSKEDGPIPITDLAAFPLRYDPSGEVESALRERGRMFWSCRKRNFLGYDAPVTSFELQVTNPRYMVDILTYRELHPNGEENVHQTTEESDDLGQEDMENDDPPPDPFVLLLPARIKGFGIHDKKWRTLLVRCLRPVSWNKTAFEQLVLDPQKKELIEALVRMHMLSSISTDVIEDKGKGLIILLHGGPGTGKTLTAESIAELVERPLYRVTCGDIGTEPERVEKYLDSVLYIGSIWQAVVLLDESDVFLEEREKTDLQRNALVSVFLRVLEYYNGILVLTSNRVGHFDEAFKSRVQLALHYPPLDADGRWQIWHNFIKMLERKQDSVTKEGMLKDEEVLVDQLRDKIDVLAREKLNGRQIRNCITTARQLARFRNQPLGFSHVHQTIQIANDFEKYVEKAHGHTASEYAQASGLRLE